MSQLESRIEPLPALIFNCERAGRLDDLIAPPYDLIDEARQQQLYARSPYNIVRLELNRDPDPYSSAAAILARWTREGILQQVKPAVFLYTQVFDLDGQKSARNGWVARIRLEEFGAGRILPHEQTFPKAKEDRLRLLTATRAQISSVFGLYPSGNKELETSMAEVVNRPPLLEATDDLGISNQLRAIDNPAEITTIQRALEQARVLIADGHHRYETALEYRRHRGASRGQSGPRSKDYLMMTLVAFDDPGLVILPTHRLVDRLSNVQIGAYENRIHENFEVERFDTPEAMIAQLKARGHGNIAAAIRSMPFHLIRLRNQHYMSNALPGAHAEVRRLDVSVLHALILNGILGITPEMVRSGGNLKYTIDERSALAAVSTGAAAGAFLLNAPTVYDIERVTNAGAKIPEKSTYFYPKLQTGLLINPID